MVFFATRGLLGPSGTNAGDIDVGTEVILNENGQPVNYLIVNQGIPENSPLYDASCEGTWLLRKDIRKNGAWNSSNVNNLAGSTIMATMAGCMDDFDAKVQEAIKTVKIPYAYGNGNDTVNSGSNGLQCKIFPLSVTEVGYPGQSTAGYVADGVQLEFFDYGPSGAQKRISLLEGSPAEWWTRSPPSSLLREACFVDKTGIVSRTAVSVIYGVRPALILPYEFKFMSDQIAA